ncbi:MAG TPA: molybdenum cofactor guanylyltransferase [Acidobacteria bacterium]|nr:molybdenum cofactor guanylyltransferase [Acidobacteriota bacterium]
MRRFGGHHGRSGPARVLTVRTAAIIAGGQATRLGGVDKWALTVGGRRIIDRQLSVLRHVAEHILIVTNDPHRFRGSGLRVCADLIPGAGPLSGVYTALVRAPTEHTVVVACDLPFLTTSFLRHLVTRVGKTDAAVPRTAAGPQPLCAVYARSCIEPIRTHLERGARRVSALDQVIRVTHIDAPEIAPFDLDGRLFLNVNTPGDHQRARALTDDTPRRPSSTPRNAPHDTAASDPAS